MSYKGFPLVRWLSR